MANLTVNAIHNLILHHVKYYADDYGVLVAGNDPPTLADAIHSINWAIETIATRCELFSVKEAFTLTTASLYDLDSLCTSGRRIQEVQYVWLNDTIMLKPDGLTPGVWSYGDFMAKYRNWMADAAGTPSKAVWAGNDQLIIHVPPSSDFVTLATGKTYISGVYLPKALTSADGASYPDLPQELHEAVALLAAMRRARPFLTEGEHWKRVESYNEEWPSAADAIRRANRAQRMVLGQQPVVRMV